MTLISPVIKTPESLATVRFQDCDPFGHLNNASYLGYFFNAREDHLAEHYDFHIFAWGKAHNAGWVVTRNQIAYLRPALVTEAVLIQTALIAFTDATIVVEGLMFDKDKRRLKAVLWTEFTYISFATNKTSKHPDDLQAFLTSIALQNDFWPEGFNQRVQALRQ